MVFWVARTILSVFLLKLNLDVPPQKYEYICLLYHLLTLQQIKANKCFLLESNLQLLCLDKENDKESNNVYILDM